MTEINPLDYYIPPFRENGVYILDRNGNMVAVGCFGGGDKYIVDILNDVKEPIRGCEMTYIDGKIRIKGMPTLIMRGWGHLTGKLGLSPDEAAKIQDAMGEWIVKKLKGE